MIIPTVILTMLFVYLFLTFMNFGLQKTVFNNLELDLERINKGVFVDNIDVKITAHTESENLANNVEILSLRLLYAGEISITK